SEFLADYYQRHGTPIRAKVLGHVAELAVWGSRFSGLANRVAQSGLGRMLNEKYAGIDARRKPPQWTGRPLRSRVANMPYADALLFCDTFTNFYNPEVGEAAIKVLASAGICAGLAGNVCCGRPLISQGLLDEARRKARQNAELLRPLIKQ